MTNSWLKQLPIVLLQHLYHQMAFIKCFHLLCLTLSLCPVIALVTPFHYAHFYVRNINAVNASDLVPARQK